MKRIRDTVDCNACGNKYQSERKAAYYRGAHHMCGVCGCTDKRLVHIVTEEYELDTHLDFKAD